MMLWYFVQVPTDVVIYGGERRRRLYGSCGSFMWMRGELTVNTVAPRGPGIDYTGEVWRVLHGLWSKRTAPHVLRVRP